MAQEGEPIFAGKSGEFGFDPRTTMARTFGPACRLTARSKAASAPGYLKLADHDWYGGLTLALYSHHAGAVDSSRCARKKI